MLPGSGFFQFAANDVDDLPNCLLHRRGETFTNPEVCTSDRDDDQVRRQSSQGLGKLDCLPHTETVGRTTCVFGRQLVRGTVHTMNAPRYTSTGSIHDIDLIRLTPDIQQTETITVDTDYGSPGRRIASHAGSHSQAYAIVVSHPVSYTDNECAP
jgi:hypothetical protein